MGKTAPNKPARISEKVDVTCFIRSVVAITRPVTQRVECISCVVAKEVAPKITVSDALTETVKVSDGERVHLGEGSRVLLIP